MNDEASSETKNQHPTETLNLLTERGAPAAIAKIMRTTSTAKIAVAFWGKGAAEQLWIDKRTEKTQIICNLESGACNPSEISTLLKLGENVEVRMHPSLHAKVYWSKDAMVIGSSNASTNGLAVEGNELKSWREANVLLTDLAVIQETEVWFDKLFAASSAIDADDIAAAKSSWGRKSKLKPNSIISSFKKTRGEAIWQKVKVSFWSEFSSENAEKNLRVIRAKPGFEMVSAYEDWQEFLFEGDYVVDFYADEGKVEYQGLWRIISNDTEFTNLSLTKKEVSLSREFRFSVVTPEDRTVIASAAQHFRSGKTDVLVQLSDVVAYLEEKKAQTPIGKDALKRQFHERMLNIYHQAKENGYTASYLLSSLATVGGYETAKSFVGKPDGTTGFYNLVELGLPELTVEHLMLQEPWRSLFSPELLAIAAQRLESVKR